MDRQFELDGPHLPSLQIFAFLIPLYLQCLLLHPRFHPLLSRFLRFILMPLSLTLSFSAPLRFAIEPRNQAVGVNFVLGIMGGYGIWKAVEWGLASDLTPYAWVGCKDEADEEEKRRKDRGDEGNGPGADGNGGASGSSSASSSGTSTPTTKEEKKALRARKAAEKHAHLVALRADQGRTESPLQVLLSSFHLLIAMRGQGYAFCGTSTRPFPHHTDWAFFRRLALEIAWSHPLLTLCAATLLEPPSSRDELFGRFLPSSVLALHRHAAHAVGEVLTGISMGVAVFAALTLGYSVATMLVFLGNVFLRRVLPEPLRPKKFDAREYPPLFNFAERPQSVAVFWSKQWHSFFSRPFRFLAFDPIHRVMAPVFGKLVSRTLGVLAVFAFSSWLHEFGLSTATSTLHLSRHPIPPLPFALRWGGSIYFMSQGLAIILEGAFTAVTGRRVKGWAGTAWTSVFVVAVGGVLYKSWTLQGLVREVPPVAYWSWHRFVVPLGCLQPPPLWMREPLPTSYYGERAL
ncbi:hypothetical protein JCM8097_000719 [Rhodosporidiobolus ruineniae]